MSERQKIGVLGATGSVGCNVLDLINSQPERFEIEYLTGGKNVDLLIHQARTYCPKYVVIQDESKFSILKDALSSLPIEIHAGDQAIADITTIKTDRVVASIVGVAGLRPILNAIPHTKIIAIANKEPLVAAGSLVMEKAAQHGTKILPVDSEHNAIFQVFEEHNRAYIKRIVLTASGGPFRTWSKEKIAAATIQDSLKHPNWTMGQKISVDSATLVNKSLELIEAHHLFSMSQDKIDIVIHPQSIIHSLVEYEDGSYLAQLGAADMRTPLAYALSWPHRMQTSGARLDLLSSPALTFEDVDHEKFPSVNLARKCLKAGQAACIAFNAANEVAVDAFLNERIGFRDILPIIEKALQNQNVMPLSDLESILEQDRSVRAAAQSYIV
jgi:1-deoxy-D-xylulose-5-phosphate reductoisomerase